MPLTDIVRQLNDLDRELRPFLRLEDPFQATLRGAVAHYARITLSSCYAPIHSGSTGSLKGHAAILSAEGELKHLPLLPDAIFAIPSSNAEFVHLDRLVRTLHVLNYQRHPDQQHLFVRVNQRHIESVPSGHGEVFENALRVCAVQPESLTLEVNVSEEPDDSLRLALDAYRARGYRTAISRHGYDWQESAWVRPLKPDVVRLDNVLLRTPGKLNALALRLRDYGIRTLIEVDGEAEANWASAAAVDLIQQPPPTDSRFSQTRPTQQSYSESAALAH